MSRQDFLPKAHDEFFKWQTVFVDRLLEKQNSFQIEDAKLKNLLARQSDYTQSYGRASNPDLSTRADRVYRDECEVEYRNEIRRVVNECIRYNSRVNDYDRQALMLVVPDRTPTPSAVPTTYPVLDIEFSTPLHHTLHIKDEKLAGKRKPEGVKECQVWYTIAEEKPTDEHDMRYAGSTSKATFEMDFPLTEQGKRVWYWARWVNTRGQYGRWGVLMTAIIA